MGDFENGFLEEQLRASRDRRTNCRIVPERVLVNFQFAIKLWGERPALVRTGDKVAGFNDGQAMRVAAKQLAERREIPWFALPAEPL